MIICFFLNLMSCQEAVMKRSLFGTITVGEQFSPRLTPPIAAKQVEESRWEFVNISLPFLTATWLPKSPSRLDFGSWTKRGRRDLLISLIDLLFAGVFPASLFSSLAFILTPRAAFLQKIIVTNL